MATESTFPKDANNVREYTISTADNRHSKDWQQELVSWDELVQRCGQFKRTNETFEEYCKWKSKDGKNSSQAGTDRKRADNAKDVGGFVGGALNSGRRVKENIAFRSLGNLDIDEANEDTIRDVEEALDGVAFLWYTTHSHSPEKPRYRVVFPLDRNVTRDEYEPIVRRIAERVGIGQVDAASYDTVQLMYWPSCSRDGVQAYGHVDGAALDADAVLASYKNWTDPSEWPYSAREIKDGVPERITATGGKFQDPRSKAGAVGLFCRTYTVAAAIRTFLPNIYTQTTPRSEDRFTYISGSATGGLVIYNGLFAYAHDATNPLRKKEVNAFDLVRLHLYGELDKNATADTPLTKMPSYTAMEKLMNTDEAIKEQEQKEERAELEGIEAQTEQERAATVNAFHGQEGLRAILELLPQKPVDHKVKPHKWTVNVPDDIIKVQREHEETGLAVENDTIYCYTGDYWKIVEDYHIKQFLGRCAMRLGVVSTDAKREKHINEMFAQLLTWGDRLKTRTDASINLKTKTLLVNEEGFTLKEHCREDGFTYVLPYDYNKDDNAPNFHGFLDSILPDKSLQHIVAEYVANALAPGINLQQSMIFVGEGRNGKSTLLKIISAALGGEQNVTSHSISSLTKETSRTRPLIEHKILNLSNETATDVEADNFKTLARNEPITVEQKYKEPHTMRHYARIIQSCNELPKVKERSLGFWRSFLIIPFKVQIPEGKEDRTLADRIIASELPGVLNWILEGLQRLVANKQYTHSAAANDALNEYKVSNDNIQQFIDYYNIVSAMEPKVTQKWLYDKYKEYCAANGTAPATSQKFNNSMESKGFKRTPRQGPGRKYFIDYDESVLEHEEAQRLADRDKRDFAGLSPAVEENSPAQTDFDFI